MERRQLLSGLAGTYYDNADFTGTSISRIDSAVSFDWKNGSPDAVIGNDTFSARWTGQVRAKFTEPHTFHVSSDGKARLWVGGKLLVDTWNGGSAKTTGTIDLEAGRLYDITLEYREDTGSARVKLSWQSARQRYGTVPTSVLYPASTPSTPTAPQIVTQATGVANVRDYGAIGNGTANDTLAIQRAIDALPAFGTLQLEPRTYKLNAGLLIEKPLTLEGNGAVLLSNTSASPQNRTITVQSALTSQSTTWSEPVVAGQSTFHFAMSPGEYAVGQWVFLELGQDPFDPNEQHFTAMMPITAVGTDSVTLGISVPYAINSGALNNRMTVVGSMATQVHIRDLKFDFVDGTISDSALWFERVRNSSVNGVSGRFNAVMVAADCTNVGLQNVNATLANVHSAAGARADSLAIQQCQGDRNPR